MSWDDRKAAVVLTRAPRQNREFAEAMRALCSKMKILEVPLAHYVKLEPKTFLLSDYDVAIVTSEAALDYVDQDVKLCRWIVVGEQSCKRLEQAGAQVIAVYERASKLASELSVLDAKKLAYIRGETVQVALTGAIDERTQSLDERVVYRLEANTKAKEALKEIEKFERLLFPIFSQASAVRLFEALSSLKTNRKITLLPISTDLKQKITNRAQRLEMEVLIDTPPDRPNRTAFIQKISNVYKEQI